MSITRDTNRAFNIIFPPTPDGICRYCHKPIPVKRNIRSKDWCSQEHRWAANKCLSWYQTRHDAFDRDKGICRVCGEKVWLDGPESDLKYLKPQYLDSYRHYYTGEKQAEIHHIIRANELWGIAWDTVLQKDCGWELLTEEKRSHWFWRIYMTLYLDVNNLLTVCQKPCHDQIHAADYRNQFKENPFKVAPTKWAGFWRRNQESPKLEDYIIS